jgi:hypothetical protein
MNDQHYLTGDNRPLDNSLDGMPGLQEVYTPYLPAVSQEEEITFRNAASCPDCAGYMVRQGTCFFCPQCGFQSCGG